MTKEKYIEFFEFIGIALLVIFFISPIGYNFIEQEVRKIKPRPQIGYYYQEMLKEQQENRLTLD